RSRYTKVQIPDLYGRQERCVRGERPKPRKPVTQGSRSGRIRAGWSGCVTHHLGFPHSSKRSRCSMFSGMGSFARIAIDACARYFEIAAGTRIEAGIWHWLKVSFTDGVVRCYFANTRRGFMRISIRLLAPALLGVAAFLPAAHAQDMTTATV